jgi:hypothetical protein
MIFGAVLLEPDDANCRHAARQVATICFGAQQYKQGRNQVSRTRVRFVSKRNAGKAIHSQSARLEPQQQQWMSIAESQTERLGNRAHLGRAETFWQLQDK